MSAEPVAVAEVYRAHYGGRTRNVGFNSVRLLVSGDSVAPGDKLYTRATLDAAVAAARAEERAAERGKWMPAIALAQQCIAAAYEDRWPEFDRLSDDFDDACADAVLRLKPEGE